MVGVHAGETLFGILDRKRQEINNTGKTFWLIKSFRAKTGQIQQICQTALSNSQEIYCLFIAPSQKGGAQPTKTISKAQQFSDDNVNWLNVPKEIKVTGKVDSNTTGLVLDEIGVVKNIKIDLWQYSDFFDDSRSVKTSQGASTVCVVKKNSQGMKSRYRDIIASSKLKAPYAVYLK